MRIGEYIFRADAERAEYERQQAQDDQRAEAKRLRERADDAEEQGAVHYAEHLRNHAGSLERR